MKLLGVLLCYNDADILPYAIEDLLESNHHLIVWDHGSNDETANVLDRYDSEFIERKFLPRTFDFHKIYQEMSKNIIENYSLEYDWVSWPDQDEILEGPNRSAPYKDHVKSAYEMGYDYIEFNNINYWHTALDDQSILSPLDRVRYYSIFPDCAPRIRSWRASETNIRIFNHNKLGRFKYPINFNLRHYPMRSIDQMIKRINYDRNSIRKGNTNFHYKNMSEKLSSLTIAPESLIYDDQIGEISYEIKFDWMKIYGSSNSPRKKNMLAKYLLNLLNRN